MASKALPADALQSIEVTLSGRPILELCSTIVVSEDMHSHFPKCAAFIGRDSHYELQECKAGDKFTVKIQPSGGPAIEANHVVQKVHPFLHEGGKGMYGAINGVSPDYAKVLDSRVKKSWAKTNTDDIIKQTHQDFSSYPIEVSKGFKQASMNGMSLLPMQIIKKAGSLSGTGSKGFYFQTHENGGKAHFKTMEDMTKKDAKAKFVFNAAASADQASIVDNNKIYDLHYQGSSISNKKQTEAQGENYNPSFGKQSKNDKAGQGSQIPGLGINSSPAQVAFPVVNSPEQEKEKRMVDRDQQNLNDYTSRLKILVNMRSDLHVGDVIEVQTGSATNFSDASPDNSASGKWLITALMHVAEPGGGPSATHIGRSIIHCVGKIK